MVPGGGRWWVQADQTQAALDKDKKTAKKTAKKDTKKPLGKDKDKDRPTIVADYIPQWQRK